MPSTLDQQDASPNADSDTKLLVLALSEFTLIDVLEGFYPLGERYHEEKPSHKFLVNAKWKYDDGFDEKLVLDGQEIQPDVLQIKPALDKKHTDLSRVRH